MSFYLDTHLQPCNCAFCGAERKENEAARRNKAEKLVCIKAGMTIAAEIVNASRGEEFDLRCVRDCIKAKRDSLTEKDLP